MAASFRRFEVDAGPPGAARMRRLFIAAVALCLGAAPALAQDQDGQLWIELGASFELSPKVVLEFETNQRFSDDRGGLYESQYLAAVDFQIAQGVTLTGGVNRVVAVSDGRIGSTEWRLRQQIGFPIGKLGSGELAGRVRLEQRFRSDGDDVGHRVRPQISYALPLGGELEIEFAHESYFNLNSTDFGQDAGHERMRNSAALSFPIAKGLGAEVGYMNQYRFRRNDRDVMEHALTIGLSTNF